MGLTVLSLFDGIGCGYLALDRAGIEVGSYYASEIDNGAISIAKHNHPKIIEIGNVTDIEYKDGILYTANGDFPVGKIDILIGGSPCTDFSTIGHARGMKSGAKDILSLEDYLDLKEKGTVFEGQSYLFWEYVRILRSTCPSHFLLENVIMSKKWQTVIDGALGVSPVQINSALLSAQNRPRLYWTNIPGVSPPADRNIVIRDILDSEASARDVSSCQTVQKCFPKLCEKYGYIPSIFNAYNVRELKDKACALSRGSMVTSSCATLLFVEVPDGVHTVERNIMDGKYPCKLSDGRYNLRRLSLREMERLQTLPDDFTLVDGIGVQKRGTAIGNCWTVDVIAHIFSFLGMQK